MTVTLLIACWLGASVVVGIFSFALSRAAALGDKADLVVETLADEGPEIVDEGEEGVFVRGERGEGGVQQGEQGEAQRGRWRGEV